MAISYGGQGTGVTGSNSLAVPYPTVVADGDMLEMVVVNKYPNNGPATPAGWDLGLQISGGSGASGVDQGSVYLTTFYRESDGTETGTVTVTITGGNSAIGRITRYQKDPAKNWSVAAVGAAVNTASTSWSALMPSDPGIAAGDWIVAYTGLNTDAFTASAHAISAPGISAWGTVTQRNDFGTGFGDDSRFTQSEHPVTTGTSTGAPTYTMTESGSTANSPAGAVILVRLREVDPAVALAGDAVASAAAAAALSQSVVMLGDATAGAAATGALSHGVTLVGASIAAGTAAAALTHAVPLTAVALAAVTATAGLSKSVPLAGAAGGAGVGSAGLAGEAALAGDAAASGTASGGLLLSIGLGGAAFVSALAAAQMAHGVPLAGAAAAGGAAVAMLTLQVQLSGAAQAAANAAAALSKVDRLAGAAVGGGLATAALLGSVGLAGAAAGAGQGTASLSVSVALSAVAVANALATGSLGIVIPLRADAIAAALGGGLLSVQGTVVLTGTAVASGTAVGVLSDPLVAPTWPAGGTARIGLQVMVDQRERIGRRTARRFQRRIG